MRFTPHRLRLAAVLVTVFVVSCVIGLTIFHQKCGLPEEVINHTLYIVQVISGNWSPDPKGISGWPFVIGSVIAVILNVLTVTGIIFAAQNFYFLKRSYNMDKMAVFELRSADQKDRLIDLLDEDTAEKLTPLINKAFFEGDKIWKEQTLPSVLGIQAARHFLNSVEKTTPAQADSEHNVSHRPSESDKLGDPKP